LSRHSEGFTKKYNATKLVYYEIYKDSYSAIGREKQIKAGSRKKKIALIESINPAWKDLSSENRFSLIIELVITRSETTK